jgi:hypothetical protein
MTSCTPETLAAVIAHYGHLSAGQHGAEDGKCCILEAVSICDGVAATENLRPVRKDRLSAVRISIHDEKDAVAFYIPGDDGIVGTGLIIPCDLGDG